jgi:hypothetical protein
MGIQPYLHVRSSFISSSQSGRFSEPWPYPEVFDSAPSALFVEDAFFFGLDRAEVGLTAMWA